MLQYMTSVIFTPERVLREARTIITEYIWGGRRSKIAYNTLVQSIEAGGLKPKDVDARVRVNSLKWVKRLCEDTQTAPVAFLQYLTGIPDSNRLLLYKARAPPQGAKQSAFYHAILKTWQRLHSFPPESEQAVRKEVIWNNL